MVNTFGLLLSNTEKSYIYLKYLIDNKIYPKNIYLWKRKVSKIISLSNKLCTNIIKVKTINDKKDTKIFIQGLIENFYLFRLPRRNYQKVINFLNKIFIHCHPGDLPQFKGSRLFLFDFAKKESDIFSF